MPWCESCQRHLDDDELGEGSACPSCSRSVVTQPAPKIPWHFWVLVAAAGGYLGWRGLQGVFWTIERLL